MFTLLSVGNSWLTGTKLCLEKAVDFKLPYDDLKPCVAAGVCV